MEKKCQCGKILTAWDLIIVHLRDEHDIQCRYGGRKIGIQCCNKSYKNFDQFLNHVSTVHKIVIKGDC